MYDSLHDAQMRLDGCIIRVGPHPVRVISIEEGYDERNDRDGYKVYFRYLKSNREDYTMLIEENVDISPVPLGYVNLDTETVYTQRIPERRWKQGLCAEGFHAIGRASLITEVFNNGTCLADTILGNYPPFKNSLQLMQHPQTISTAFCRIFAIQKKEENEYLLMHIGREVGKIENERPTLNNSFTHLTEALGEVIE